ncbi:hypothetical protein ACFFJB_09360 [Camelimonas abortus]|uniref:Uncharacterized protein n=1 Tax=Camelimonas abortus TaxID=1017184 RepID=A0ABV7LCP3_9HYPH
MADMARADTARRHAGRAPAKQSERRETAPLTFRPIGLPALAGALAAARGAGRGRAAGDCVVLPPREADGEDPVACRSGA